MHLGIILLVEVVLNGIEEVVIVLAVHPRVTHNQDSRVNQDLGNLFSQTQKDTEGIRVTTLGGRDGGRWVIMAGVTFLQFSMSDGSCSIFPLAARYAAVSMVGTSISLSKRRREG